MLIPTTVDSKDITGIDFGFENETLDGLNEHPASTEADLELEWARALENEISLWFNANRW